MWRPVRVLLLIWGPLLCPSAASSQEAGEAPHARAAHVESGPVIDGVLDDAVWDRADILDAFTQVVPVEGASPSERTEVRILTDGDYLYFGIRAWDSDPSKIVARRLERDAFFFFDDNFTLVLDTFHDRRNGYFFQVNPLGGRRDGTFEGTAFENNWNGIWRADGQIDSEGWTAEIAIPFKTLSFEAGQDVWGLNMVRRIRRRNEEDRWADPHIERMLIDVSRAGELEGLAESQQGIGLDAVPALSIRRIDDPLEDTHDTEVDPSLDVFYKVLPSLTAALTSNTDFAETESDLQRVNLTRFSLFFPEKRDFFLQDSGIFNFGGLNRENGIPFFSRRIGIDDEGEAVALPIGGKLTGRAGRFNLGFLDIQQDSHGDVRTRNLAVGRVSMNVLEESTLGAIVTRGDPNSNFANSLVGTDFNYRSSSWFGNRVVRGHLWYQRSFTGEVDGQEGAYGAEIGYPNDRINWNLKFKEVQENFNPSLGFVNRTGIRRYDGEYRYRVRPTDSVLRTIDTRVSGTLVTDRDDTAESALITLRPLDVSNDIDDAVELRYQHGFERLHELFEIQEGIFIPAGSYHFDAGTLEIQTSHNRALRGKLRLTYGSFFNGRRLIWRPSLEWRPSPNWLLSVDYEENRISLLAHSELTGGSLGPLRDVDFETRLLTARINIAFTPNISWNTLVQYENVADTLSIQSRLRWIIVEGRELFLVVNQGFDTSGGDFRVGRTEPVAKLGWTLRF